MKLFIVFTERAIFVKNRSNCASVFWYYGNILACLCLLQAQFSCEVNIERQTEKRRRKKREKKKERTYPTVLMWRHWNIERQTERKRTNSTDSVSMWSKDWKTDRERGRVLQIQLRCEVKTERQTEKKNESYSFRVWSKHWKAHMEKEDKFDRPSFHVK